MARIDELRFLTRIAHMYHEQDMSQSEIADRLALSQATISRLLKRAEKEGLVRVIVSAPNGAYPDLEEGLITQYDLQDAVVTDCGDCSEEEVIRNIGAAAAYYLEATVKEGECIGISSWSSTLLAMVNAMHRVPRQTSGQVVQILGGTSASPARRHAVYLANQLARLVGGEPIFLSAPCVVDSKEAKEVLLNDSYVREVMDLFDDVTLALVGIGAIEPSPLIASSGNIFSSEELGMLRQHGAVGDVLARFYDRKGKPIEDSLRDRVIGMNLDQIKQVKRSVGVAGGKRKHEAIRGALLGKYVNVLITDYNTAEALVQSN